MEVNLIILPKKNSDINLGMKRQIRQLFEKLFNDVNDSSFLINIDDNVEIQYIRFHDLRHSCASLLLKNGVPMKQIQEWLGHSDFSTTANIYAHLDCSSKLISADAMLNGLGMDSK